MCQLVEMLSSLWYLWYLSISKGTIANGFSHIRTASTTPHCPLLGCASPLCPTIRGWLTHLIESFTSPGYRSWLTDLIEYNGYIPAVNGCRGYNSFYRILDNGYIPAISYNPACTCRGHPTFSRMCNPTWYLITLTMVIGLLHLPFMATRWSPLVLKWANKPW